MAGWTANDLEAIAARRKAKNDAVLQKNRENLAAFGSVQVPMCKIGIDPSIRVGGLSVCVIDEDKTVRFLHFKGRGIVGFIAWLFQDAPVRAKVVIEDSSLQDITFRKGASPKMHRNVGMNQGISIVIRELCQAKYGKENVRPISPKEKGAKLDDKTFKALLSSNNHTLCVSSYKGAQEKGQDDRDAYKLAQI